MQRHKQNSFRAFIAIELPEAIKSSTATITQSLQKKRELATLKWVPAKKWHITLCFLGNITSEQFRCVSAKLKTVAADTKPFALKLTALQPFPTADDFRILSMKPEPVATLTALALTIKHNVAKCGLMTEERPFRPHITLARTNGKSIDSEILHDIELPALQFGVQELTFFRSEPQAEGSVYAVVGKYPMQKAGLRIVE